MSFSKKIHDLRKSRGLTQQEVAEYLGISRRAYIDYEKADRFPRGRDVYIRLAEILKCNVDYLLDDNATFIDKAVSADRYQARMEAQVLVNRIIGLLSSGALPDEDKDSMINAISSAYIRSRKNTTPVTEPVAKEGAASEEDDLL